MISNDINVDSCLVRIPIDYVQVNKESGILDTWMDYNEDTQEIRDKKRKTRKLSVPGIGYDFYYSLQNRQENDFIKHFLYLTINAKMNKKKYFDGVTLNNIEGIYQEIIAQKVVYFELDTLLKHSVCTDVDFKKDFTKDPETYQDLLKGLKASTRPTRSQKGYKPYRLGIEWNSRNNATPARPYVKIYDKETELKKADNKEFYKSFLTGIDTTNLRRIEFQIKNKKHFDTFNIYDRSLLGVLSLTQETKRDILRMVMTKVVDTPDLKEKKAPKPLKLTPAQQFMKNCLKTQLKTGVSLEEAINDMTVGMNSNNTDKYKKKLKAIHSELVQEESDTTASVNHTLNLMAILQSQNLDFTQL